MQEVVDPKFLLPDELWEKMKPLIPPLPPKKKPGRTRMDDRKAMNAIFYVLRTGCQWKSLPRSLGASSTVHDRFSLWVEQDLFFTFWQQGLTEYDFLEGIDWQWQAMDGCHVQAPLAGECTGPSYKHGAKSGTNRSLLTDGNGIPLALHIAPANCVDMKIAEPTLNSFALDRPDPAILTQHLCLDKGYDALEIDVLLSIYRYVSHIRRRNVDPSPMLPGYRARRWVVERTHSWINRFRRLLIRWEKRSQNYLALLHFACAYITFHRAGVF